MNPRTFPELLRRSAQRFPRRSAIAFGRKKITYEELDRLTDQLAVGLAVLGIRKLDRVAMYLDNCPEFVIGYYSILKAGAVVVPVNSMFKFDEARFILEDSEATCLITSRSAVNLAEDLRLAVEKLRHIVTTTHVKESIPNFQQLRQAAKSPGKLYPVHSAADDLAVILYTSATTGLPKGAMLSHRNLIANAADSLKAIRATQKDSFICLLPLFHSFAATVCMNIPLFCGAKIVIVKAFRPFRRVIRNIRKHRVSIFVGVPSIYNILKDMKLPLLFKTPLFRLFNPIRVCISGASALSPEILQAFENKFRVPLLEGYGLTEASPVVSLNPLKGKRTPGSIGLPISRNVSLRIVDEHSRILPANKIGELIVKGPNVMLGYYRQEKATRECIKDGWLFTGDMARIDEDGYAYIVGRKKEMIKVKGLNVYPREIEDVLYQNPKVKDAAVIGIPDIYRGEVPKAFVVLKEGAHASEYEIIRYLKKQLASYKIPKSVEFRQSLPRSTTGKVLKRVLIDEETRTNR